MTTLKPIEPIDLSPLNNINSESMNNYSSHLNGKVSNGRGAQLKPLFFGSDVYYDRANNSLGRMHKDSLAVMVQNRLVNLFKSDKNFDGVIPLEYEPLFASRLKAFDIDGNSSLSPEELEKLAKEINRKYEDSEKLDVISLYHGIKFLLDCRYTPISNMMKSIEVSVEYGEEAVSKKITKIYEKGKINLEDVNSLIPIAMGEGIDKRMLSEKSIGLLRQLWADVDQEQGRVKIEADESKVKEKLWGLSRSQLYSGDQGAYQADKNNRFNNNSSREFLNVIPGVGVYYFVEPYNKIQPTYLAKSIPFDQIERASFYSRPLFYGSSGIVIYLTDGSDPVHLQWQWYGRKEIAKQISKYAGGAIKPRPDSSDAVSQEVNSVIEGKQKLDVYNLRTAMNGAITREDLNHIKQLLIAIEYGKVWASAEQIRELRELAETMVISREERNFSTWVPDLVPHHLIIGPHSIEHVQPSGSSVWLYDEVTGATCERTPWLIYGLINSLEVKISLKDRSKPLVFEPSSYEDCVDASLKINEALSNKQAHEEGVSEGVSVADNRANESSDNPDIRIETSDFCPLEEDELMCLVSEESKTSEFE